MSDPPATCGELTSATSISPTAARSEGLGPARAAAMLRMRISASPRHPGATPKLERSAIGPPPRRSDAWKLPRLNAAAPSTTKLPFTQCRSASRRNLNRASGCKCHSRAPASRPATLMLPAEPCQSVPEKSSARAAGGGNLFASEAGSTAMTTTRTPSTPISAMRGQRDRAGATGGAAFLAPRRSEGDVGIDYSRAGGAIDGDRIDRKAVTLIERSKPGHQGIEGSRLQLHTYAAAARLRSLQGGAEAGLPADAVDDDHGGLAGVVSDGVAAGLHFGGVHLHPGVILAPRGDALDGVRDRRVQRQQHAEHENQHRERQRAAGHHALFALLQGAVPGFELGKQLVHGCPLPPATRTCKCASIPPSTGCEDWMSAVKPCLLTCWESCDNALRLGAV